jgi:hypothetical protein
MCQRHGEKDVFNGKLYYHKRDILTKPRMKPQILCFNLGFYTHWFCIFLSFGAITSPLTVESCNNILICYHGWSYRPRRKEYFRRIEVYLLPVLFLLCPLLFDFNFHVAEPIGLQSATINLAHSNVIWLSDPIGVATPQYSRLVKTF